MQAIWIKQVCVWGTAFCLLGFPLAVLSYRIGWLSLETSFNIVIATFVTSCLLLACASVICLVGFWQTNIKLLKMGGIVCLLLMLPVGGLLTQLVKGKALPKIHDITTDWHQPPQFQAVPHQRKATDNSLEYPGEGVSKLQNISYPDIEPLDTAKSVQENLRIAIELAGELGWDVIASNKASGLLEAVDTTLLWGFKDDIAIRVRETDRGSRIDLRSVSRVGLSDLGANAKRIQAFIDLYQSRYPSVN